VATRGVNLVLAVWLFISAFVWPHTSAQVTNTWILGVVVFVFALVAIRLPGARYVNALAAVWLFISAFALPRISVGTAWNDALVALVVFFVALAPSEMTQLPSSPHQPHTA
jgi:SPW repeat